MPSIASLAKTIAILAAALSPFSTAFAQSNADNSTEDILMATSASLVGASSVSAWPSKIFAPYCDVLLWPTFDIANAAQRTGGRYFTLAFITADSSNMPSWGGIVPLADQFYMSYISSLRAAGGNVIVSFGGANGQELALVTPNVNSLFNKYNSVITTYGLTYIDFDVEGIAVLDTAANTVRAQALALIKKKHPNIIVSYTLPVLPTGLTQDGVNILRNAAKNGLVIDVVNIMAMDYGSGVAPNGANGMGDYAIQAAKATYSQAVSAGFPKVKIGITPMIGQNDVQGEVFTLSNARQVLQFAKQTSWVSLLSFWSINRDTNVNGPLYASSQIKQNLFDFANIFKNHDSTPSNNPNPSTDGSNGNLPALIQPNSNIKPRYKWPLKTFAPYADVVAWPPIDLVRISSSSGATHYVLAFIVANGANNDPSWGGYYSLSDRWYMDQITAIRNFGGDVIISFGGAINNELATVVTSVKTLQAKYQAVIDAYYLSWVDFDIEGTSLGDQASVDRRNAALRGLQIASPNLIISYTLPVLPTGLTQDGVNLLKSARAAGVRVDVVNIMAMDYGADAAPNGANGMGDYAIQAAKATYAQAVAAGYPLVKIGITPMIGQNDVQGEVFSTNDAAKVTQFAKQTPWVSMVSFWAANRDDSSSSGVPQKPLQFSQTFVKLEF